MAITNLAVFGGAFFTPIVVGKITHTIGWEWTFHLVAIFTAACLPLVILYVPEPAYRRSAHLNTDLVASYQAQDGSYHEADEHNQELQTFQSREETAHNAANPDSEEKHIMEGVTQIPVTNLSKDSFLQTLRPFSKRLTDDAWWKLFLRPIPLFVHPAVFWSCLIQGKIDPNPYRIFSMAAGTRNTREL